MFSFLSKKVAITALINERSITVNPKETLLQAALRQGIDFPHSCRVGGCATCKCQLVSGKVKELTETGYVLSDAELDQGYILACQSVPQTDIRIAIDLSRMQAVRKVSGRVVGQEKYTHDITCLRVRLDDALAYKAGQFANISLEGLPGLSRSYSFASPVQPEAQVQFFVRQVPGGVFSTQVNTANLLGTSVSIEGPQGDFWLRPSDAPLLMVAGGSGLAPILAMLQEALANHTARDVTLLFGARKVQDLYAVDAIEKIRQQWKGTFTFVPVLSDEPVPSEWQGQRGLVTDHLAAVFTQGQHAYLCGPPGMIDSAEAALKKMGIEPADIRADRFITLHEAFTKAA